MGVFTLTSQVVRTVNFFCVYRSGESIEMWVHTVLNERGSMNEITLHFLALHSTLYDTVHKYWELLTYNY